MTEDREDFEALEGILDMRTSQDLWRSVALRRATESSRTARKAVDDLARDLDAFQAHGVDMHAALKKIMLANARGITVAMSLGRMRRKMQAEKAAAAFEVLKKSQKGD